MRILQRDFVQASISLNKRQYIDVSHWSMVEEKSHSAIELLYASLPKHNNRPFAASHSRGTKLPR